MTATSKILPMITRIFVQNIVWSCHNTILTGRLFLCFVFVFFLACLILHTDNSNKNSDDISNLIYNYPLLIAIGVLVCVLGLCGISWCIFCGKYKEKTKNDQLRLERIRSANSVVSKSNNNDNINDNNNNGKNDTTIDPIGNVTGGMKPNKPAAPVRQEVQLSEIVSEAINVNKTDTSGGNTSGSAINNGIEMDDAGTFVFEEGEDEDSSTVGDTTEGEGAKPT